MKSIRGKQYQKPNHEPLVMQDLAPDLAAMVPLRVECAEDIPDFLDPKLKNLVPEPHVLTNMAEGLERLRRAIETGETIGILGDYDVDGACSTALMYKFLQFHGITPWIYIPDRLSEGYGPNHNAMAYFQEKGCTLLFILDCGTAAKAILDQHAVDMIILDHHLPPDELPQKIVINPQLVPDIRKDLRYLCACGVVFLFLAGYNRTADKRFDLLQHLDIVALATVCDVMMLQGMNRALVKQGLKVLATGSHQGIALLAQIAGVTTVDSPYACGFVIGPRINAGGRIGSSSLGVRLLISSDPEELRSIAYTLDQLNTERRQVEQTMLEEAMHQVETKGLHQKPCILVGDIGWHPGVVGIVASRLKDRYHKPALVVGFTEAMGIGSARSVGDIDIGSLLSQAFAEGLLLSGGGHAKAGGFKVMPEKWDALYAFLEERIPTEWHCVEKIDLVKPVSGLTPGLQTILDTLQPYGQGNPEPLICVSSVYIQYAQLLKEQHVRCMLVDKLGYKAKGIAFYAVRNGMHEALFNSLQPYHVMGHWRDGSFQIVDLCPI